jgi:glutamate 5-kinase
MAQTVVVKVGTSTLTGGKETLDIAYMADLVGQICGLMDEGVCVVLVTSGAIRSGMAALNLRPPLNLAEKQAAAAVGQSLLMHTYRELFARHGRQIGQVLLTRTDVEDRERFLNARRTFQQLLRWGVVPIVNENDTVATDEIRFGDNDLLAALTALVVDADVVLLLSDVDGFFVREGGQRRLLSEVRQLDETLWRHAGQAGRMGTGGMVSKLQAAEVTMQCGILLVLANGRVPEVLRRVLQGEPIGTRFLPLRSLPARKRWIAFAPKVRGRIVVNEGAKERLMAGSSLLPAGVLTADGNFAVGDLVAVVDERGQTFAKGLTNYTADQIRRIAGLSSHQIPKVLGTNGKAEIIHRDNLVVLSG